MLDYEKVAENTIRFIDGLSKEEWISLLKEGGLLREDGEPEVKNPHRPEQLLYGGDWYEEYFVQHEDDATDSSQSESGEDNETSR